MQIKIYDQIPQEVYDELPSYYGASLYHTQEWHNVLRRSFSWNVKMLAVQDSGGELIWGLPFVRKRRMGKLIHVCLPLSHRVGPIWREGTTVPVVDLLKEIWPVEIHEDCPLPNLTKSISHSTTNIDLKLFNSDNEIIESFHKQNIRQKLRKQKTTLCMPLRLARKKSF